MRFARIPSALTGVLISLALLCDGIGVLVGASALWTVGGWLGWAGVACGGLALVAPVRFAGATGRGGPARGAGGPYLATAAALLLYALALWLRGTVEVRPDRALLLGQAGAGLLLLTATVWRARRIVRAR